MTLIGGFFNLHYTRFTPLDGTDNRWNTYAVGLRPVKSMEHSRWNTSQLDFFSFLFFTPYLHILKKRFHVHLSTSKKWSVKSLTVIQNYFRRNHILEHGGGRTECIKFCWEADLRFVFK